jgi:hypothetical protein
MLWVDKVASLASEAIEKSEYWLLLLLLLWRRIWLPDGRKSSSRIFSCSQKIWEREEEEEEEEKRKR